MPRSAPDLERLGEVICFLKMQQSCVVASTNYRNQWSRRMRVLKFLTSASCVYLLTSCGLVPQKIYEGPRKLASEISVLKGYWPKLFGEGSNFNDPKYFVLFVSVAKLVDGLAQPPINTRGGPLKLDPGHYRIQVSCFRNNGLATIYAAPFLDVQTEPGKQYTIMCRETENRKTLMQLVPVAAYVGAVEDKAQ
jgi:hypothetical protein